MLNLHRYDVDEPNKRPDIYHIYIVCLRGEYNKFVGASCEACTRRKAVKPYISGLTNTEPVLNRTVL